METARAVLMAMALFAALALFRPDWVFPPCGDVTHRITPPMLLAVAAGLATYVYLIDAKGQMKRPPDK